MKTKTIIIGVDGGATKTTAHCVHCDSFESPTSFELAPIRAARVYDRLPDFEPVPVDEQLAQRDAGVPELTARERIQGAMWVQSACNVVAEVMSVASRTPACVALVGMGMPGLKTSDGRGICVINNGPRIPDYLDQFERRLTEMGVELLGPVAALGSDADYCGIGEQHAADGLFRDVDNAYYVGCGTGIADAMKLHSRLITFDEACAWIQKSWQMFSVLGTTFEKLVSAKSMNDVYARLGDTATSGTIRFPETDAARGNALAIGWMGSVALILADLIFERIRTVKQGAANASHRGPAYAQLQIDHPFVGTCLDRVVIGQRIGQVYGDPQFKAFFSDRLDVHLAAFIVESGDAELIDRCLDGDRLKPGFCRPSKLRAAPALGAAISAVRALHDR